MTKYYVVQADNIDFDLDAEMPYSDLKTAQAAKENYERQNPEVKFTIWALED